MRLSYVPPVALPRLEAAQVRPEGASGIWVEPPGTPRAFTRYAPEFIDDPGATGMFDGIGQATYTSPPVCLTALDGAMLFGYRALAWQGLVCTDEPGGDPAEDARFAEKLGNPDSFLSEDTRLRPADAPGEFVLDTEGRPTRHVEGAAVVLCSHEPSNYGSLLFRLLPKLHTVRALGLQDLPMVAWAHAAPALDLLGLLGVPAGQVIQHDPYVLTTFGRVLAPSLRNPHGFLDPQSRALLLGLSRRFPGAGGGRRIYLSRLSHARRSGSTRVLLNEEDLARRFAALGFEVVEPERLGIREQIETFAAADIVAGPSGSAMFNVVFCRPGTKVLDIESEPHWIYAHAGLFASCQLRYGLFVGQPDPSDERPVHRRWTVDVDAAAARAERFMRA